MGFKIL